MELSALRSVSTPPQRPLQVQFSIFFVIIISSLSDEDRGLRSSTSMMEASEAAKGCKIKEVSSIAKGLKACKEEFSKCRKYEDEVISIMAACSHPVHQLKQKAAILYTNKMSIETARTKVAGVEKTSSSESCGQFLQSVETCKLL